MPVAMNCPNCRAQFRLADEMAGKKMKCQKCQQLFVVPQTEPADGAGATALDMELDDKPAQSETAISTKPAPPPPQNPDDEAAVEEDSGTKGPRKPPPLKKEKRPRRSADGQGAPQAGLVGFRRHDGDFDGAAGGRTARLPRRHLRRRLPGVRAARRAEAGAVAGTGADGRRRQESGWRQDDCRTTAAASSTATAAAQGTDRH